MKRPETTHASTLQDLKPRAPYVSIQESAIADSVDLSIFIYKETNYRLASYVERPNYDSRLIEITIELEDDGGTYPEFFRQNSIPVNYSEIDEVSIRVISNVGETVVEKNSVIPVRAYDSGATPTIANEGVSPEGILYGTPYGYLTKTTEGDFLFNYFILTPFTFDALAYTVNTPPPYRVVQVNLVPVTENGSTLTVHTTNTGPSTGSNGESYSGAEIFVDIFLSGERISEVSIFQKTTRGPVILSYTNLDDEEVVTG